MPHQLEAVISSKVQEALSAIGRTEDIRFSPDNRRIAIAGFLKNQILLIDIAIEVSASNKKIHLLDCTTITSPSLKFPHGLSFVDNNTIGVANRGGTVIILALPEPGQTASTHELTAIQTLGTTPTIPIKSPGSLAISNIGLDLYEVLICNNYTNKVTRHILDKQANYAELRSEILLSARLDVPDGVATNEDYSWIAISNHNSHEVLIYENSANLNLASQPNAILQNVKYPHGLCFTRDGDFIVVADAGTPCVHIYAKNGTHWDGVYDPITSIQVLEEETYLKGRYNPEEGGPKGIDISNDMQLLATTCDQQTIAFFDLENILSKHRHTQAVLQNTKDALTEKLSHQLECSRKALIRELSDNNTKTQLMIESLNTDHAEEIQQIYRRFSWRVTAPLRKIAALIK